MEKTLIIERLIGVMKDVGAVLKLQENKFDNYKFRGIDDIYNALQPALIKNEVVVNPKVLSFNQEERESQKGKVLIYTTMLVEFKFHTVDGSFIECTTVGEAMDRSDKSANKAMSSAYKYAMFQTFAIPTEENKDPENNSHKLKPKTSPKPATEKQIADIEALRTEKKIEEIDFANRLQRKYSTTNTKKLTKDQADELINLLGSIK